MNRPLFIIGAGRSGTNVLRDSLTSLAKTITWPCDEINPIWRHGNRQLSHDEFGIAQVNKKASHYIIRQFEKIQKQSVNAMIVEKTCANSLRIPFIDTIFPEARYLCIIRDGYDVTLSAKRRWVGKVSFNYIYRKAQYVPISDIPFFAWRFFKNRFKQMLSHEDALPQWGPIYEGMENDVKNKKLIEVCAKQWARCVQKSLEDLRKLDQDKVLIVRYEEFAAKPNSILQSINQWLGMGWSENDIDLASSKVSKDKIGRGKVEIIPSEMQVIAPIIEPVHKVVDNEIQ